MKVNNKLIGMFTGAAMAIGVAVPPAFSADGKAEFHDLRRETPDFVDEAPYTASGQGRVALVVHTVDSDLLKAIHSSAGGLEDKIGRDIWVLLDHDKSPIDRQSDIRVFVSGQHTGTLTVPDTTLIDDKLTAVVQDGVRKVSDKASIDYSLTPDNS
jgi:hypothetical protein